MYSEFQDCMATGAFSMTVAKFECFSRFQGQDRSIYMLCQFKLNKPRRWMHGIRWFIFSTRLPFSARPGTLWVLIWTPNTSFVSLREPTRPFVSLIWRILELTVWCFTKCYTAHAAAGLVFYLSFVRRFPRISSRFLRRILWLLLIVSCQRTMWAFISAYKTIWVQSNKPTGKTISSP